MNPDTGGVIQRRARARPNACTFSAAASESSDGDEAMGPTWSYLDLTPLGRQETWEDSPNGYPQTPPYKWWNWHDNYQPDAAPDPKWVEVSTAGKAAFRKRAEETKGCTCS